MNAARHASAPAPALVAAPISCAVKMNVSPSPRWCAMLHTE
jgi:hypothetical protein